MSRKIKKKKFDIQNLTKVFFIDYFTPQSNLKTGFNV